MFQQQQPDRDYSERVHYGMNLFATADNKIKANVRNESPEYSLGDREGQGDEDYSQKRRQTLFNFPEIDLAHAPEHRRADQQQNRRRSQKPEPLPRVARERSTAENKEP